jgi:hypothetical protein
MEEDVVSAKMDATRIAVVEGNRFHAAALASVAEILVATTSHCNGKNTHYIRNNEE